MNNQLNLEAEDRTVIGKQLGQLRRDGFVPANVYGGSVDSKALQVDGALLEKLLSKGGNNVIQLNVGGQPAAQVLIKQVQRHSLSGKILHIDFYRVMAGEKLKASVHLHFINTADLANLGQATVARSLSEVMVECFPSDLPTNIPVDLSQLKNIGDVIRIGDLAVSPDVTILAGVNDPVAGLYQQAHLAEAEEVVAKEESSAPPQQPS
jgi:large subunit ribosomal protein L25